jgi:hypothetical protein
LHISSAQVFCVLIGKLMAHLRTQLTLVSTDKGFKGFDSFVPFKRSATKFKASLTGHVYRVSHGWPFVSYSIVTVMNLISPLGTPTILFSESITKDVNQPHPIVLNA